MFNKIRMRTPQLFIRLIGDYPNKAKFLFNFFVFSNLACAYQAIDFVRYNAKPVQS